MEYCFTRAHFLKDTCSPLCNMILQTSLKVYNNFNKRCLITLNLKPFRSQVKMKHLTGKEFAVLGQWKNMTVREESI